MYTKSDKMVETIKDHLWTGHEGVTIVPARPALTLLFFILLDTSMNRHVHEVH